MSQLPPPRRRRRAWGAPAIIGVLCAIGGFIVGAAIGAGGTNNDKVRPQTVTLSGGGVREITIEGGTGTVTQKTVTVTVTSSSP